MVFLSVTKMWKDQLSIMGEKYHTVSYDVRGHGKTDSGDGQYSIDSHVDDLVGLIKHLKIQRSVLVGLSMGGYIALRAVEKHPELFAGLALCDTKSEADSNEAKTKRFQSIKDVKTNGTETFAEGYIKNVFTPETLKNKPTVVNMIKSAIISTKPINIAANFLALAARTDTTESLSKN
jgi:3-oxoadipate enol-lactonase